MKLCDVNVLIYAHRQDASPEHDSYAEWLKNLAGGQEAFGLSESVLSGFVRIVTNPRAFHDPTPVDLALDFCENLRKRSQACILRPGDRNWTIFESLCRRIPAKGKLVADAWHAALAIEYDCEWITTDSDFVRFPGLKWKHPLNN
ncbi:MAG: type II toxin-antitoxin system VapC family toxin [Verrucomicrobia bacterium]|nr:type II toxin-antitoxin system VapC family toxin [Verrucomicrobiota bacterium]